jgi:hypothetical protein
LRNKADFRSCKAERESVIEPPYTERITYARYKATKKGTHRFLHSYVAHPR